MENNLIYSDMDWIVGGFVSYFRDDAKEKCCKCKRTIYFRPYVDRRIKKKLICLECCVKMAGKEKCQEKKN